MNTNISSKSGGCIITDRDDIIVFANEIAKAILNRKNLIGTDFNIVKEEFFQYDHDCVKTECHNIFWINDKNPKDFISSILEHSFDEIFVCDNMGRSIYCNKTFEKHYGITCREIIGKDISSWVSEGIVDRTFLFDVIKSKKQITYEQKTIAGKTILNTSTPVLGEDGNVMFVVENCRDITEINELKSNLYNAQERLIEVNRALKSSNEDIIGPVFKNASMVEIEGLINNMAPRDVNMLILGKSGTGKTRIAKLIHKRSHRRDNAFVSINCSTIPESLLESELFGYEKGAFTGASDKGKIGLVEKADGGTLFLDEIGEIPLSMQVKLLELVQEHTFIPVGATKAKKIDVRIIAATNQDLQEMIIAKKFREDLYYRLSVVTIKIPPLSERPEDVSLLLNYYLDYYNRKHNLDVALTVECKNRLINYNWPGNIRELEHLMEFLVLNCNGDTIELKDLPTNILDHGTLRNMLKKEHGEYSLTLKELLEAEEARIIRNTYKKHSSSYSLARKLGISQSKAYRLITKYCDK